MNPAVRSVLTNGLPCSSIAEGANGYTLLTAGMFTLCCSPIPKDPVIPPVVPLNVRTGGGGPVTNARPLYPPSEPDLVYIDPHKVMGRRVPITITFKMGDHEVEKIYTVSISKADVLVRVMNIVNNSKKKVSASASNIVRRLNGITILYKHGRSFISKRRDIE